MLLLLAAAACGLPQQEPVKDSGAPGCAAAGVQFAPWANLGSFSLVYGFAVGDLDRDGLPEVLVAQSGSSLAVISPPARDGGSFSIVRDIASGAQPTAAAVGDLDRDGRADLVSGNGDGSLGLSLGAPAGLSFVGPTLIADGGVGGLVGVAIADLDGDGWLDLVAGGNYDGTLRTFLNQGDGRRFTAGRAFDAGGPIGQGTSGDLDGDGRTDVAFTRYFFGVVTLTSAADGGAPRFAAYPQATRANLDGLSLFDFDGDGRVDVLQAAKEEVGLYRNLGGGTFRPERLLDGGGHFTSVAAGDLDRDGRVDLVAVDQVNDTATVFTAAGGALRPTLQFGADAGLGLPSHVAVEDFDGDGRLDFAVSNYGSSRMLFFRNVSCVDPAGPGGAPVARWSGVGCAAAPMGAWATLALLLRMVRRRGNRARPPSGR